MVFRVKKTQEIFSLDIKITKWLSRCEIVLPRIHKRGEDSIKQKNKNTIYKRESSMKG